jgi:AraC-like DNA-binding protein
MTRLVSPPPDAVSEALRSLSVRSTVFCVSDLRAPWAFSVDGEPVAKFHLVLEGSVFLSVPPSEPVALGRGDLVVLPRGTAHTVSDSGDSEAVPLPELLADDRLLTGSRLRYGGTGSLTRLLCGGFALAEGLPGSPLAALPEVLVVEGHKAAATAWLEPMLSMLGSEADEELPGANAIVAKIADVLLAQALRVWLVDAEPSTLAAAGVIGDDAIAKAVSELASRPSEDWSLDRLAKHVGLSRSALAVKFREIVGEPPMRYLTRIRLSIAARDLVAGRLTIEQIARRTGYQNEATLSKAFKREFGQAPGAYRQSARRPPPITIAG